MISFCNFIAFQYLNVRYPAQLNVTKLTRIRTTCPITTKELNTAKKENRILIKLIINKNHNKKVIVIKNQFKYI